MRAALRAAAERLARGALAGGPLAWRDERQVRGGGVRLALQALQRGARTLGRCLRDGHLASCAVVVRFDEDLDFLFGLSGMGTPARRASDKPDRDRLLGVLGAMLAFANVVDLLAHEFARGSARRLAARAGPSSRLRLVRFSGMGSLLLGLEIVGIAAEEVPPRPSPAAEALPGLRSTPPRSTWYSACCAAVAHAWLGRMRSSEPMGKRAKSIAPAVAPRDDAVLLVRVGDDEVVDRAARRVAHQRRSPGRPSASRVPRSRESAIQPASVRIQFLSRWWPITLRQHRDRDVVDARTRRAPPSRGRGRRRRRCAPRSRPRTSRRRSRSASSPRSRPGTRGPRARSASARVDHGLALARGDGANRIASCRSCTNRPRAS